MALKFKIGDEVQWFETKRLRFVVKNNRRQGKIRMLSGKTAYIRDHSSHRNKKIRIEKLRLL